jgi:hypothetical protein
VSDQIDQRIFGKFRILRNPITDALNAVAFENFDGVVAETGFESFEFSFIAVVSAKFIDTCLRQGAGREQGEKQKKFSVHEHSVANIGSPCGRIANRR